MDASTQPPASADHAAPAAHGHHVCSTGLFAGILAALLFFTFITVAVSQFDFGGANMWIAMAVASIKAALVITVFMHLLWDTNINRIFFLSSFLFLGLMFLFCFADLLARGDLEKKHARRAPLQSGEINDWFPKGSPEYKLFKRRDALKQEKH